MVLFFIVVIIVAIADIMGMKKRNEKKELAVYSVFCVLTIAFGWFYFVDPFRTSFVGIMLEIFKIKG